MGVHTWYFIRLKDVITGAERWAKRSDGAFMRFMLQQTAEMAALLMMRDGEGWEYADVVEIDDRFETVSERAA